MSETQHFGNYPSLRDRVVLITGGGSGIGAAFVEQFALQGASVAFLDIARDCSTELISGLAGRCTHTPLFLRCDLTDIAQLRRAVADVERSLGPVRVLVNNAANDDRHQLAEVTPEYWGQRMAVNLNHHFFSIQAVFPGMKAAGGGSIINMSSIAWMLPTTQMPAYVAAKAAIVGLTHALSQELAADGIRINCVLPGAILTERQRRLWMTPEYEAMIMSRQSIKRHIAPEEVARLVLFLASDDSSAITNQSHIIDGGWV